MKVNKICPFRTAELVQGPCESECQLFVIDQTTQAGSCALSALPGIRDLIKHIDHVIFKHFPPPINE